MNTNPFSKRHGFNRPSEVGITIHQDAPHELRGVLIQIAYATGYSPSSLRNIICQVLRKRPDRNNWSEYPNIDDENHDLIDECEWYKVYDVIEAIYQNMKTEAYFDKNEDFENQINEYFMDSGIGWQLRNGIIESRGDAGYEATLKRTDDALSKANLNTARKELHEAISDLSRRPTPDITGAIQHAMACLECVAREACGDPKATLGEILNKYEGLVPKPLDQAITKAWGYASENGRHIREGREPSYNEAELLVGICASISTYLSSKEKG